MFTRCSAPQSQEHWLHPRILRDLVKEVKVPGHRDLPITARDRAVTWRRKAQKKFYTVVQMLEAGGTLIVL